MTKIVAGHSRVRDPDTRNPAPEDEPSSLQWDYSSTPEDHLRQVLELWEREAKSCSQFSGCSAGSVLARRKIATIEAELRRRAQGGPKL